MRSIIRRCGCGKYSMRNECPSCGNGTNVVIPPRYSPEDKYARYRRQLKYDE